MRTIFHPQAPLFKSNLLRLIGQSDSPLLSQQLQLIPSVVEFLCGQLVLAPKLSDCASLWPVTEPIQPVWPDHTFIHTLTQQAHLQPIYLFVGKQGLGQVATARYLAQVAKCPLLQVKGSFLREQFGSLEEGISHVIRDGRLAHAFLYIDASGSLENLETDSWLSLLLPYPYTVIISREEPWVLEGQAGQRPLFQIQFSYPNHQQRQQLWQLFLENLPIASDVDTSILATQFSFTPQQIKAIIQTAHHKGQWHKRPINQADLFAASRSHSQQGLRALATHISPHVSCNDLVVPDLTANLLKQIISRMRHQAHVFETWGWAQKTGRNQGLYALFQGKPGTGKTMAAEAIAHELGCDLYQVDLSLVVSKYIGETEKHLGRIFHLAEQSNAVLFFDEADALFGKRSEVRDSHDKYANMETSYLLQRMEQHSGLVILATNFQVNMDTAFLRRLHFVVTFPLPDVTSRERIWRTTFPQTMPLSPEVDFHLLAKRFELAGGHIRNIMLQASFFAAETRQIVGMKEILLATQQEYRKLGLMADVALFNIDRTNES